MASRTIDGPGSGLGPLVPGKPRPTPIRRGRPNEPWVYAYYSYNETVNGPDYNRIVRVQATGDTGGSMEVLLDHIPTGVWHIGGPIQFGPDGKLYAVIGDSYNAANAQNLTSLA